MNEWLIGHSDVHSICVSSDTTGMTEKWISDLVIQSLSMVV